MRCPYFVTKIRVLTWNKEKMTSQFTGTTIAVTVQRGNGLGKGIANKSMVIFYQISVGIIITIIRIPYTYGIAWYSEYIGTKLSKMFKLEASWIDIAISKRILV